MKMVVGGNAILKSMYLESDVITVHVGVIVWCHNTFIYIVYDQEPIVVIGVANFSVQCYIDIWVMI